MTTDIQNYLNIIKKIYANIIEYIEDESNFEERFQQLNDFFEEHSIKDSRYHVKEILYILSQIAINHHRDLHFFDKIEKIVFYFKDSIPKYFTNIEVFNLFRKNYRVLLYLIKQNIVKIDTTIVNRNLSQDPDKRYFLHYFYPECKELIKDSLLLNFDKKLIDIDQELFEEKRQKGENDNYICKLIQNDSVEEFITYVNKTNMPLSTKIDESVFETNYFLQRKVTNLIEYSVFFGSIQIFRYLFTKDYELLTPQLWMYAIHGKNPEIIHILEENHIEIQFNNDLLNEAIKCHHNDIANYIQNNYFKSIENCDYVSCLKNLKFYNFYYFPKISIDQDAFFFACKNDYLYLVELLFNTKEIDINHVSVFFRLFIKYLIQKFFFIFIQFLLIFLRSFLFNFANDIFI